MSLNIKPSEIPKGSFEGFRAINIQTYDESNKKLGLQWEVSREIIGASSGQRIFSVLKVGVNNPIDLKARILGGTGEGVVGKIYWLTSDDILSFGTPSTWYNFRTDIARQGLQPESEIYAESEVTFVNGNTAVDYAIEGRKVGADAYRTTKNTNQSGGLSAAAVGGNRIIYPGEYILFEILSKSAQDVTATIDIYEGGLDLPRP